MNEETRKLHAMVEQVKKKPEVRLAYMRFDEVLYWEKIEHITDVSLLKKLVKLAAKTDHIGDFENILETQSFDCKGNL